MSTTSASPIAAAQALDQAIWMDFMSRQFLESGELKGLIEEDGLEGVTSNPTIFDKAISHSADYDEDIRRLVQDGKDPDQIYYELTSSDIRRALDLFTPTYERSHTEHGYVSLEVSPLLAHNTPNTLHEAKKLWDMLARPNAMIKIPGTPEGLPAVEEALFAGINVNITLLFSVEAYEAVAKAYVRALKRRADAGLPVDRVASVASFFVSRIDVETDKRIEEKLKTETDPARKTALKGLLGKAAIANAKNAYVVFRRIFEGSDFAPLKAKGAKMQRVLWASVGTKNPAYPDTYYVDELIGPHTVSTIPPETYHAFKDHGKVRPSLAEHLEDAPKTIARLGEFGIDFKDVTNKLLRDGVESFAKSFASLMDGVTAKRNKIIAERGAGEKERHPSKT